MRKEIVVTGIGMVTPLGLNVKETWRSLSNGANGVARIQRFDPTGFPVRFAAEVPSFDVEPFEKLSPLSQTILNSLKGKLTYKAVKEALHMSGLDTASERVGVAVGSEASRPHLEELAAQIDQQRIPSAETLRAMSPQAPVDLIREITGLKGPSSVISTACTSSSQAVGEGLLRIRRGEVDAMIVGGVDVLVDPIMVTGFSLLGALSTRNEEPSLASRPFDVERDGFVLGEGAGFLILEERDFAVRRNAAILGKISGYGCSCNAYRITDSPPDGRGAAQSMEAALRDAQLVPEAIGYINAHGTSTKMNDTSETRGIYRAFGNAAQAVSVSSTKSMMGHLVAACGAVEAIVALQTVRTSVLP
ncbi:MAG: beta-ketoacyl-[acyl-carrier-protein] synthase family protein, partial [Myxococcota bacterium]|nr:beta-ketoacyl-[acyl-carrier-protein] synthase family protein [Myxococcota bacterium]